MEAIVTLLNPEVNPLNPHSARFMACYCPSPLSPAPYGARRKPVSPFVLKAKANLMNLMREQEDVVIVGAGIAGLATAVSLRNLGIPSLVLEQAESLRTGGTSLTLFKNGWRVLDALGVASLLRPEFLEIQGMVMKSPDGRELRSFGFKDEDQSQEVRAVERRVLLETLAGKLPADAISFSSKLANIEKPSGGNTVLQLDDGSRISAKIVIACDGIRSPVARWMGFPEPRYVGHCALRGLGFYPDGQPFGPSVNYIYGRGVRGGFVPVSSTKVYWFVCFNSSSPGPKITDPSVLRQQTKKMLAGWPSELLEIIDLTPDDTIIRTPLVDRWLWPGVSPPPSSGNIVLVGDAMHPMTPNLGQGACCALEDAVVLAKRLSDALNSGTMSVEDAFKAYGRERWPRIFPLTVRANLMGNLLQSDNPAVCSVRNNIMKVVSPRSMLEHTNFEFEYK